MEIVSKGRAHRGSWVRPSGLRERRGVKKAEQWRSSSALLYKTAGPLAPLEKTDLGERYDPLLDFSSFKSTWQMLVAFSLYSQAQGCTCTYTSLQGMRYTCWWCYVFSLIGSWWRRCKKKCSNAPAKVGEVEGMLAKVNMAVKSLHWIWALNTPDPDQGQLDPHTSPSSEIINQRHWWVPLNQQNHSARFKYWISCPSIFCHEHFQMKSCSACKLWRQNWGKTTTYFSCPLLCGE